MGSQTRISARRARPDTISLERDTNPAECAWLLRFEKSLLYIELNQRAWLFARGASVVVGVSAKTFTKVPQKLISAAHTTDAAPLAKFIRPLRSPMRLDLRRLLSWTGAAWWGPDTPCIHCAGTGHHNGSYERVMARHGRIKGNRLGVDRNLLARVLEHLTSDTIELEQPTEMHGEQPLLVQGSRHGHLVRAVIAPVRNASDDVPVFIR